MTHGWRHGTVLHEKAKQLFGDVVTDNSDVSLLMLFRPSSYEEVISRARSGPYQSTSQSADRPLSDSPVVRCHVDIDWATIDQHIDFCRSMLKDPDVSAAEDELQYTRKALMVGQPWRTQPKKNTRVRYRTVQVGDTRYYVRRTSRYVKKEYVKADTLISQTNTADFVRKLHQWRKGTRK